MVHVRLWCTAVVAAIGYLLASPTVAADPTRVAFAAAAAPRPGALAPATTPRLATVSIALAASTAIAASTAMAATGAAASVERRAPRQARHPARNSIYVDLFGKGGLYGLGYERRLFDRFAIGGVASYYVLGGDRFATVSPYLAAYPWRGDRHGWFVQAGPQVIRRSTPSPGPEWSGLSSTSVTAEVSTGYEYRRGVLLRGYAMGSLGARFAPWLGVSVGWSL